MPSDANLALRELGIVLFLACVGLKAGSRFIETLLSQDDAFGYSQACSSPSFRCLLGIVARTLLKMNFVVLSGLIAGSMTDPPALAFANTLMNKDAPFGVLPAGLSTSHAAAHSLCAVSRPAPCLAGDEQNLSR